MGGFKGRNREVRKDKSLNEITDTYTFMEAAKECPFTYEDQMDAELIFWDENVQEMLDARHINFKYDSSNIPEEVKKALFEEYFTDMHDINDEGYITILDPGYGFDGTDKGPNEALFCLGLFVGSQESIGCCYKLLTIPTFAKGFWAAKLEKAYENQDLEALEGIRNGMEAYDEDNADALMNAVINICANGCVSFNDEKCTVYLKEKKPQ